jgi:hypothetical protein
MSRRMDYTVAVDAPPEKVYQDFTSREYWQTLMATGESEDLILHNIKYLFDDEEAFTADWISKHH